MDYSSTDEWVGLMPYYDLNDQDLKKFREMPKVVENPKVRWIEKHGHRQRNFRAVEIFGKEQEVLFQIYQRQNIKLPATNFSCGILLVLPGNNLMLARYNSGHPGHLHDRSNCHIHWTCERVLQSGGRPERYAETTDRYTTLDEAMRCLEKDFKVNGLPTVEVTQLNLGYPNGS